MVGIGFFDMEYGFIIGIMVKMDVWNILCI